MLKTIIKISLVFVFFAFSVPVVFAAEYPSAFHKLDNETVEGLFYGGKKRSFYYGGGFGMGVINWKPKMSVERQNSSFRGDIEYKGRSGFSGAVGAYAGFGQSIKRFYVGGELSAFYRTGRSVEKTFNDQGIILPLAPSGGPACPSSVTRNFTHRLKMTLERPLVFAFDIMPGFFLNNVRNSMVYGRLGVGANWIRLKIEDSFAGNDINTKADRIRFSYRMGAGFEYFVNDSFSWRIEYLYSYIRVGDEHNFLDVQTGTVEEEDVASGCFYSLTSNYKYAYDAKKIRSHLISLSFSIRP